MWKTCQLVVKTLKNTIHVFTMVCDKTRHRNILKNKDLLRQIFLKNQFVNQMWFLYGFTFLVVLPLLCHNLRFSLYYIKGSDLTMRQDYARQEDVVRLRQAREFFRVMGSSNLKVIQNQMESGCNQIDVAFTVVTVARNKRNSYYDHHKPFYLTQVSHQLLEMLYKRYYIASNRKRCYSISICNVNKDPSEHYEAMKLSDIFRVFSRSRFLPHGLSVFEREKRDYMFCLNKSLALQPRYVAIIEDDALPLHDLTPVIERLITSHSAKLNHTSYVKLYHPERVLGFINLERERIPELISIGMVFGSALNLLYSYLLSNSLNIRYNRNCVTLLVFSLYCMLVALAIGRPNILELRRYFAPHLYSVVPAPECCTPAMLFPSRTAADLVNYLSNVTCNSTYAKDMALPFFTKSRKLNSYLVSPNLIRHIGMYSSVRNKILDPATM